MVEVLSFTSDAAIIGRLGYELVAKQETALVELVKNAFDADATKLAVCFEGEWPYSAIELRDNGSGMSRAELTGGFLRLAAAVKSAAPISPIFRRQRAGRKGIGRFAAQRLGKKLVLDTRAAGHGALKVTIDWEAFVSGLQLSDVGVTLEEGALEEPGSILRIEGLRDAWTEAQIRRCWRSVVALQQPFPVAPVDEKPASDPGFEVSFVKTSGTGEAYVVANLQSEILDHLHALIELKVDNAGNASWRLAKNKFGADQDWIAINHNQRRGEFPDAYQSLKGIYMKAYYYILDPNLLPPMVYTRLRDVLSENGGIRLYRNGFRVVPYGDPGNDWLRLDEVYTRRSLLAPFANKNFFGVVEINDPEGVAFEEHTSREGLIETPAFLELRELVSSTLITAATRIAKDRGRKTRAGGSRGRLPKFGRGVPELRSALDAMKSASQTTIGSSEAALDTLEAKVAAAEEAVASRLDELQNAERALAGEASMLRLLATLGMVTAEFNHETGMTFDAFRSDFSVVFKVAQDAANDAAIHSNVRRASAMFQRLDHLTSYLNSLASARANRDLSPQSLSKVVEDFVRGIRDQAASQTVNIEAHTPPFDPLFTRPMHAAELASVLLNLYTNAVKAMVRAAGKRQIEIRASRDEHTGGLTLLFSDTGDGISDSERDRVFDAFYTTSTAAPGGASDSEHITGTGLGLWIVSQIVSSAGGEVLVVAPREGYSTTVELQLPAEEPEAS